MGATVAYFNGLAGCSVLQNYKTAAGGRHAYLTGQIAAVGRMQRQVSLEAQLGVVALAARVAREGLFVGVVRMQVVLQVVFAVKHLLTVSALVGLLW